MSVPARARRAKSAISITHNRHRRRLRPSVAERADVRGSDISLVANPISKQACMCIGQSDADARVHSNVQTRLIDSVGRTIVRKPRSFFYIPSLHLRWLLQRRRERRGRRRRQCRRQHRRRWRRRTTSTTTTTETTCWRAVFAGGNAALKIDKRLRVESTSQGLFGVSARRRSWRGRLVTSKRQRQRIPERNFTPMCLSIYSRRSRKSPP